MARNNQKKIAVINDMCGFGRCSVTAALPIISAMRIQCCPMPTSIFSNHTGYDSFYSTDFTDHMQSYMDEWKKLDLKFDGILTGYLGSARQLDIVVRFLDMFRERETVTVIDPIMGDGGRLYSSFSSVLASGMKRLVPYADILTPNLTEACILADCEYRNDMGDGELLEICKKLAAMGPEKIVISGLDGGDDMVNLVYESGGEPVKIREHRVGACRSGTGDVFSAIIAADAVNGVGFSDSVRHASAFIAKALRRTVELELPEADGICFEEFLCGIQEGL